MGESLGVGVGSGVGVVVGESGGDVGGVGCAVPEPPSFGGVAGVPGVEVPGGAVVAGAEEDVVGFGEAEAPGLEVAASGAPDCIGADGWAEWLPVCPR